MASSLYSNAQHVDFDSVLGMDDLGMVSMFEALMASGLRGFLGCPAVVYEDALVDFFENASVRNGVVFSTVGGQIVNISEKLFAETFELPIEGLGDLSEMPKDAIFDARSIVSLSGEQINLSGRKNQMKMPYRLLCDIVAKAISVKAGSFNAITVEKFSLMTVVVCGVKMNWAKFLFGVLKRMFSAKSKQAKGFAIQISVLLATFPTVELGEASEFPASKILSKKTVLRFVSINDRDGAEEISGAAKKKAVSKKRTAADIEAAVPKKKRSLKKKSISSLELVEFAEEDVLDETRAADAPADKTEPAVTVEKNWYDLPYDDLVKQWEAERPVVTASDTEDEDVATADVAPADEVQQRLLPVGSIRSCRSLQLSDSVSSFAPTQPTVFAVRVSKFCSVFVNMSLFSWLPSTDISEFLSSIALDRTILHSVQNVQNSFSVAPRVQLALEQQQSSSSSSSSSLRFDHTDVDATASSRLPISQDLSALFADFQATLSEQLFESQSNISSKLHKIEQSVRDSLSDQAAVFKSLSQEACQESRTLDDVQKIRFNEFRKTVLTQNATIFQGLADVRKEVDAVHAKVDIMAKRLNDFQKDAEATKEAHSHQLFEFQSQAQENHNVIHAQLSELVDYIHRGSADKKGEKRSRRPQQPAATQITGSAVTPSFEQRVQMAQRRIVQTVLNADAANRERQGKKKERSKVFEEKEKRLNFPFC
ncbi:dystroglycan-like [Dorcoceras hygrometricum]|uniref:Dystroglycan-like n=1 Tax=Dorcoceras hygrometricum TaxID=472368 RepID=A0A2Z7D9A3_9LAMI|nr:dystroglycan-like [Dorcoceras hygrometricum]